MLSARNDSPTAVNDRTIEIERIIAHVIDQENAGVPIDDAEIERQHPDLMPELREQLMTARLVRAAAEKARQELPRTDSDEGREAGFKDELRWLSEHLTDFDFINRLDHGGQGAVYKAVQKAANRTVAVKVLLGGPLLSDRQRQRFAREVDLVSKLRHPNIVTLYESGTVLGRPFFAMEYVEGLPIDKYMVLHHPPVEECVRLFSKVCRAVSHAHLRGIIHRDLKPANILVDEEGEPHILDFGLARHIENATDQDDEPALTIPGQVFGTLPYLSPEQAGGVREDVDTRSDIYALGVILYHLLTWSFPYPVKGDAATVRANIINVEPMSFRAAMREADFDLRSSTGPISDDVERIVFKALSKDKARRYQSATAFADDLDRYLVGDAVEAKADSGFYILKKTIRKYRVHTTIAAAFLVLLVLSSVLVTGQWMKARTQRDNARQIALLAHATLDETVRDFDEAIRPLAGGTRVRARMLARVAVKLEQLRPLVEADVSLAGVLAALRERQGDIAYALGKHAAAAEHYTAALRVNRQREQAEPAGGEAADELQLDLLRAQRKLALVSDEAEHYFEAAITLGEQLVRGSSVSLRAKLELCTARIDYAQDLFDAGRYERAAPHLDAAVEIAEPMARADPAGIAWSGLLVRAYSLRGRTASELGDGPLAQSSLEAAVGLLELLKDERPTDVELRQMLLSTYLKLGTLHRNAAWFDSAEVFLKRAAAIGKWLIEVDPNVAAWKRELYGVHHQLSQLLLESGRGKEAQAHCEEAVVLAEELAGAEPNNAEWQRVRGFARICRGRLLLKAGEPERALSDFVAAVDIHEDLAQREPDKPAFMSELAMALDWLGKCSRKLDQPDRALGYYTRALEIRERLLQAQPAVPNRALDLVLSQTKLATWHLDRRTPEADQVAAQLLTEARRSLIVLRDAGRLGGHERRYASSMKVIDDNLGLIRRRTGEGIKTGKGDADPSKP